ncbi:dihydroneopterin aldolase [bacterium]|nr:MAG: dihydroneopterin aldolase [bacterium]
MPTYFLYAAARASSNSCTKSSSGRSRSWAIWLSCCRISIATSPTVTGGRRTKKAALGPPCRGRSRSVSREYTRRIVPARSTYQVFIRGLETYAHHGVPDHEQATGHRYRLDLELSVKGVADRTDEVTDTVNYAEVAQAALRVLTEERRRTLEFLSRAIAEAILTEFPSVFSITLSLEKPFPPAPVIAASMGVRFSLERDELFMNRSGV